jgi:hypothetical protein
MREYWEPFKKQWSFRNQRKSDRKYLHFSLMTQSVAWFQTSTAMYMRSELFWNNTQRRVVILYRRFGTTHRSHLQGSRSRIRKGPLKMGPVGCLETSVQNYQSTLRNIPQERRSQLNRLFAIFSLQRTGFFPRPIYLRIVVCKWHWDRYFITYFGFTMQTTSHQCSLFIFIYVLHLTEAQSIRSEKIP